MSDRCSASGSLIAGVVVVRRPGQQRRPIRLEALRDRLRRAPQALPLPVAASRLQHPIERGEALHLRNRDEEVAATVTHKPLYLPLVVPTSRAAEAILEQIMRAQLAEDPRALTSAVAQDPGDRNLGVVVEDGPRHALEEGEGAHMAVAEGLRRLRWISFDEAGVRVRQADGEEVDLALHASYARQRLAEVRLRMARRMGERDENLLLTLSHAADVVLHDRDPASKAVLVAQPIEDPLRGVTLLLRAALVFFENGVDHANERIELRAYRRTLADVARRNREPQHLVHCPRVDPEPSPRLPLAYTLDHHRVTHAPIQIHALHPPPFANNRKGSSLMEFYSGETRQSGRFNDGFLLRRSQLIGLRGECWAR